jgi:Leucine-rich repeat (LRR) protein
MHSPSKQVQEKAASQYERKLARQRQLDLMEAAASGTAPSMELDFSSVQQSSRLSGSDENSLRSRNEGSRRFQADEEEITFQNITNKPKLLSSPIRSSNPKAKSLFEQRGRPDGLSTNTGLNLMDHTTGVYKELTTSERMINNIKAMFSSSKTSNVNNEMYDADHPGDDYGDYIGGARRTSKRRSSYFVYCKTLLGDRKRRTVIYIIAAIAIFVALASISTVRLSHTSEKVLREQNTVRFNSILDHVIAQGVSHTSKFTDYTSPEYHALRWIAYSDPAKLPLGDPMIATRYALATFFYNSYLAFEKQAGRQKPIEIGDKQWEGVPNPGWTRKDYWMTEKGVCQWFGVHCAHKMINNPKTGQLENVTQYDINEPPIALAIRNNHMVGSLVPELKALVELKHLDLGGNKLAGSFPSALGRLYKLELLHLPNNRLSGSLSADFGSMENVKDIDLQGNGLSGELPTELNRLYSLETLRLSHNNFTGDIPDLTACQRLISLYMDHNQLSADFPFSVALHASLKEIYLNNNNIKGTIPGEIETIQGLEKIRLESNMISGSIPRKLFARMSSLREVAFENNKMTGQIPTDVSAMGQLQLLSLSGNKFSGPLPSTLGTIYSLQKLHLKENGFTGTIPVSLGDLTGLKELWLQSNHFNGGIPTQLSRCNALETLFLESNELSGGIPSILGQLTGIKTFRVHSNELDGTVPLEICALKKNHLKFLTVDCNSKVKCPKGCCSACY